MISRASAAEPQGLRLVTVGRGPRPGRGPRRDRAHWPRQASGAAAAGPLLSVA